MVSRTNALLFRALPALVLGLLVTYAVFGPSGVVDERRLAHEAEAARAAWLAIDRENDERVFELQKLKDPLVIERLVADELGRARPGARLYVFEGDELAGER